MLALTKIKEMINKITIFSIICIVGLMTIIVITQTLSRYLFKIPIFWAEEFTRYLMIWGCFLGAALAIRDDEHISLSFLGERLSKKIRSYIKMSIILLILFFLLIFLKEGFALLTKQAKQLSPCMRMEMWIPFLALPIGGTLMFLEYLFKLMYQIALVRKQKGV